VSAHYRFLPWVRTGSATSVEQVDTLGPGVPGRATVAVDLVVNDRHPVPVTARLQGPGDVVSLDTRMVVRTDPPHLAAEFEPNYFPLIEFDRPDLPWMFTPATGDRRGRLRPWLTLVAVRRQPGVDITVPGRSRRPVLRIAPPARPDRELPELDEAWAWAHAQVVTADGEPVDRLLDPGSNRNLSRLVCPRRLEPGTAYVCCLVPAFEAGRRTGLGLEPDPDDDQLRPAWSAGEAAPASIELPVYYHWEFSTGDGGDFEALARRLQARPVPPEVGGRPLELRRLGFGLPDVGPLTLGGALRVPGRAVDTALPAGFETALAELVNTAAARADQVQSDPVVGPPLYGGLQAAVRTVDRADRSRPWLAALNLDPRLRAAAGLGVLVVQGAQEQLMASAWEQLGPAGQNRFHLEQPKLGRAVLGRVHARLARLEADDLLEVTAPLHARVRPASGSGVGAAATATLQQQISNSRTPSLVTSVAFRRAVRPRGPLVRRPAAASPQLRIATHVASTPPVVFRRAARSDMITPQVLADQLGRLVIPSLPERMARNVELRAATGALQSYFSALVGRQRTASLTPPVTPAVVRQALLAQLDPARTVAGPVAASGAGPAARTGPADTSLPGPSFPQPMYEPLRDLDPQLLLPGCDEIPFDSVAVLESDPQFIEAYLVGLNHEMSRELLWREYPSDERATAFRCFWPPADGRGVSARQIPPLHQWDADTGLGRHFLGGGDGNVVLLVRGELLHRYPGTTIYATRSPAAGGDRLHPLFRGQLTGDMTFVGFALTRQRLRAEGWFLVFEQQPTEPRFGLDAETTTGRPLSALARWDDLAWGDLADDDGALRALDHLRLAGRLDGHRIGPLQWGANAGHMAAITLQRAVRVAIAATDLVDPPAEQDPR
jgi:hypothetical protein